MRYDCPAATRFGDDPPLWKTVSALIVQCRTARNRPFYQAMQNIVPVLAIVMGHINREGRQELLESC